MENSPACIFGEANETLYGEKRVDWPRDFKAKTAEAALWEKEELSEECKCSCALAMAKFLRYALGEVDNAGKVMVS